MIENQIYLWPAVFFKFVHSDHKRLKSNLLAYCYSKKQDNISSGIAPGAKRSLYESTFDFLNGDNESIRSLKKFILDNVFEVSQYMNAREWPEDAEVNINLDSWCHITNNSGFHDIHNHPMCSWCGVYYLQIGETNLESLNGINRWYNPSSYMYNDAGTMYTHTHYDYEPLDGDLVIFPSHISHSALPYKGYRDRVVIAFNATIQLK
jgi:uncharacterized protein (TIGR02466 family)